MQALIWQNAARDRERKLPPLARTSGQGVDLWNENAALALLAPVHSLVEALARAAKVPATLLKLSQVPWTVASTSRQLAKVPASEVVPLTLGEHLHKAQQLLRPQQWENAAVPLRCRRKRTETRYHFPRQGDQPLWVFSPASEKQQQDPEEGLPQSREALALLELVPTSLPRAEPLMVTVAQKTLLSLQSWAAQQLLHCLPPLLGWLEQVALQRVLGVLLQAPGLVLAGLH